MTAAIAICDDLALLFDQVAVPRVVLVDKVPVNNHAEYVSAGVQYGGVPVPDILRTVRRIRSAGRRPPL